jgi:ABC-2 type transport system permease protein
MIQSIRLVAAREFVTTVSGKGFIIGLLLVPAMLAALVTLAPRILSSASPQVRGDVAVIDSTGRVLAELRTALDPAVIAERRRAENTRRMPERRAAANRSSPPNSGSPESIPALQIIDRPADADVQREKSWLFQQTEAQRRLALIVIHSDAIVRTGDNADYGEYDLYIAPSLDDDTEMVIHGALRQALVGARLKASGLDQDAVEAAMRVERPSSIIVTPGGEQTTRRGFTRALPFICGLLLFMGVIATGQTLMTSTIEEKSSRVVEVLLAAVSPLDLMWGKLLGQLGIGLVIMGVYIGLGTLTLFQFSILGLLDPMLVVYLIAFFLVTYLVFGALMMAIGAAVNQMAEAQSLMGPIMLLLLAPYLFTPLIGQAPNSAFSVTVSFIPPINAFAMLARLASDTPPPGWQVALTLLIGLASACIAVWFAAKIFKIGLLMHGKPPNVATLIRWARMA